MSNLKKRIEGLKSSTSSSDAIFICDEALKQYAEYSHFNLPPSAVEQLENNIAEFMIPQLESITDSAVSDFVNIEKRILGMNNLGVKKTITTLKESELAKHPAAMYIINRVTTLNNTPEWLAIEEAINTLSPLSWDPQVKECLHTMKANFEKYNEDIRIYRAVHEAKNSRSSFLMSGLEKDINNYLNHRTPSNRAVLLENLNKYVYDTNIRKLYNEVLEADNSFQLKAGKSDATITKLYSPVLVTESEEIFVVHGKAYTKSGSNMRPLTETETKQLPSHFVQLASFLSQPNVEISENKIKVFSRDKKVELVEESNEVAIYINEKKVTTQDFHRVYLNAGIFRFDEKDTIAAVTKVVEHWDSIFELDYAKSIYPKGISSRRVDIFRINEKTYLNTVDTVMNENIFYSDCNATQSRNMVLEFAKYDLGLAFKEYLISEEVKINELTSKKKEFLDAIAYLNDRKNLLENHPDADVRESAEVKELLTAIVEEISTLKNEYSKIDEEFKTITTLSKTATDTVNEGLGVTAGDEVEYLKKKQ